MNCLKKMFMRYNFVPMLVGMGIGLVISLILYPDITPQPTREIVKEVEKKVYVEIEKEVPVYIDQNIELEYLGKFNLTAYCSCSKCCGKSDGITATGVKATPEHTVAVDKNSIPYGSKLLIMGKEYVAEDCGGAVKGNVIDIYFDSHEEALKFGKQKADVYLIKEVIQ